MFLLPSWNPGEWGEEALFSVPFMVPELFSTLLPISFDVILLQLLKYF